MPELLPLKYDRMRATPFAFFRGSVGIMAADLAAGPRTAINAQLCGDAHVQNMGCFESPDGRLVFDINDFDETTQGPWEWDVKRMAASIVLAGYDAGHSRSNCSGAVEAFASAYTKAIDLLALQPILEAARHQIHRAKQVAPISAALKQAMRASPADLLKKYTLEDEQGKRCFKTIDKLFWSVSGREKTAVLRALPGYVETLSPDRRHLFQFFEPLDVGFKVVGTGSVALRDYIVLMQGNGPKDSLFLQIKQEVHSAYAQYLKGPAAQQEGMRVVNGQRHIQPLSDPLLGWTRIGEHDYLVRQLNDHKGSIDIRNLRGTGLCDLAQIAGALLARGHARSGDAAQIRGYLGTSDRMAEAIARFAVAYAERTEADFELFQQAIHEGRIKVDAGPLAAHA